MLVQFDYNYKKNSGFVNRSSEYSNIKIYISLTFNLLMPKEHYPVFEVSSYLIVNEIIFFLH